MYSVDDKDTVAVPGIFAGEYFVANKRANDFDWSLGLGWGSLGSRGTFANPLSFISSKFNTRGNVIGTNTGNLGISDFFRGRTALSGGVQYQTPWAPLILKAELEGNSYQVSNPGFSLP